MVGSPLLRPIIIINDPRSDFILPVYPCGYNAIMKIYTRQCRHWDVVCKPLEPDANLNHT